MNALLFLYNISRKANLTVVLLSLFVCNVFAGSWKVSEMDIRIADTWTPGDFHEGLALVDVFNPKTSEYRRGYINVSGKWVVEPIFMPFKRTNSLDINGDFHDGMALVLLNMAEQGSSWSYINKDGKALQDTFSGALPFKNGYATVISEGRHGHINTKGEYFEYDALKTQKSRGNGYRIFRTKKYRSRCGYINPTIRDTIPPRYLNCGEFRNGLAKVNDDKGWHFINSAGRTVLTEKKGTLIQCFNNGFAVITNTSNNKMGLIDRWGRSVLPTEFDYIGEVSEEQIVLTKKNGVYKYFSIRKKK